MSVINTTPLVHILKLCKNMDKMNAEYEEKTAVYSYPQDVIHFIYTVKCVHFLLLEKDKMYVFKLK